jgi:putative chitinase
MKIDRKKFFDGIRDNRPFRGHLLPETVKGCEAILAEFERRGLTDLRWCAAMLSTAVIECGIKMQPVREIGQGRGKAYGKPVNGKVYYGRGLVQLTWYDNYVKFRDEIKRIFGVDIVENPDGVLRLEVAVYIMFEGMIRGSFRKVKLADFFNATTENWLYSRGIINGTKKGEKYPDRAEEYTDYAKQFYADLQAATIPDSKPKSVGEIVKKAAIEAGTAGAGVGAAGGAGELATTTPTPPVVETISQSGGSGKVIAIFIFAVIVGAIVFGVRFVWLWWKERKRTQEIDMATKPMALLDSTPPDDGEDILETPPSVKEAAKKPAKKKKAKKTKKAASKKKGSK